MPTAPTPGRLRRSVRYGGGRIDDQDRYRVQSIHAAGPGSLLNSLQPNLPDIAMAAITYTEARKHLGQTMDRVIDDHQPVVITRANGKNAVLISQEDFDAWQETAYLLRSPANAADLRQALAELGERRGLVHHDLIEQ